MLQERLLLISDRSQGVFFMLLAPTLVPPVAPLSRLYPFPSLLFSFPSFSFKVLNLAAACCWIAAAAFESHLPRSLPFPFFPIHLHTPSLPLFYSVL